MADFIGNTALTKGAWTNVTGGFAGQKIAMQNTTNSPVRVHFGATAPAERADGIILQPQNWPPLFGTVLTQVWVHSLNGGEIHISGES